MAKGDGIVLNVIGLVLAIVSLFLMFFNQGVTSWTPVDSITEFFKNIGLWGSLLMNLGMYFSNLQTVFFGLIVLFPLLFIVAGLCILVGIKGSGGPGFGAFVLLVYPVIYIIIEIIALGASFMTMLAGAWVMLAAGILCAIGASRNGD